MFIEVLRDFSVRLKEPQDFKRFKLVIDAPRAETARLRTALEGVASLSDDGHAWVSEAWLRHHDPSATWQDGLTAMIGVARKYGWVNEAAKTIRAHIEWPGEAPAQG